jgi:hypothetical protein
MMAQLVGETLPGMRALDVVRGFKVLAARADVDPARMTLIGRGGAAVPSLYAALLDSSISTVALEGMLNSYDSVVNERLSLGVAEQVVPSALKYFDFPDIVAALAPRRVILDGNLNPVGKRMALARVREDYARALSAYERAGASNGLRITARGEEDSLADAIASWSR